MINTSATGLRDTTALDITGDTAMLGVENLPAMTIGATQMIRASATEEASARLAKDVCDVRDATQTTTVVPIRRSVATRARAAGLPLGVTGDGLQLISY